MPLLSSPHLLDGARWKNKRVGLLGGSFNPPHRGHVHISLAALRGLHLDCVWWLVTPQNPLKSLKPLPLDRRVALSSALTADHPKIIITALESAMNTQITFDSIKALKRHFPQTDFVWISGMDNAHSLHTWHNWRGLLAQIPMVHITRPPAKSLVKNAPVRMYARQNHVHINHPARAPLKAGTTYWMMQKQMINVSSTALRAKNRQK